MAPRQPTRTRPDATTTRRPPWVAGVVVAAALLLLGLLYLVFRSGSSLGAAAGTHQVGTPGVGDAAVPFTLASTAGRPVGLSDYTGKSVLLYFHEGLGCQPCWDQIRDLQKSSDTLHAAGIDDLVTITSGPLDLIAQKMHDDNLTAIALADTDLAVSRRYHANEYGMMGSSRDGHSFLLVGPDGRIQWRADFGGSPNYTMYVPVDQILRDLTAERRG